MDCSCQGQLWNKNENDLLFGADNRRKFQDGQFGFLWDWGECYQKVWSINGWKCQKISKRQQGLKIINKMHEWRSNNRRWSKVWSKSQQQLMSRFISGMRFFGFICNIIWKYCNRIACWDLFCKNYCLSLNNFSCKNDPKSDCVWYCGFSKGYWKIELYNANC